MEVFLYNIFRTSDMYKKDDTVPSQHLCVRKFFQASFTFVAKQLTSVKS